VTLHSPEEQEFYGRTLEEALAWCLVWLMATGTPGDWGHELGVGPFLIRLRASSSCGGSPVIDSLAMDPADRDTPAHRSRSILGRAAPPLNPRSCRTRASPASSAPGPHGASWAWWTPPTERDDRRPRSWRHAKGGSRTTTIAIASRHEAWRTSSWMPRGSIRSPRPSSPKRIGGGR
jgi:hypothetical protein